MTQQQVAKPSVGPRAGAGKTFRPYAPDQLLLLAPSIQEWLPDGHLARFVSDLVEEALDLRAIYAAYAEERGYPPYDPRLMVKLLLYGYATGTPSSRKLEARSYDDLACRFLCADQHPDFRSIARFRRDHREALAELFVQALGLCRRAGLLKLGTLALDGTKLRANASRHKAMSYARMVSAEEQLKAQIAELLQRAEALDAAEDERFGPERRGDELPAELARREQRLARIREAKEALEAEAAAREQARRSALAAQGKRPRRPPKGRDPFSPRPNAQRNFSDPDSRIMKTADGAYQQCYSGQAIVDERAQVIVAAELSAEAADVGQLAPALAQLAGNLAAIDAELAPRAALLADAGYFCADNVSACAEQGLDPFIATGRFTHAEPPPPAPRGRIPTDATAKQRMARKLATKKGRAAYARRKTIVEPVFGQIVTVQNGRRLLLRGLEAARAEWRLHCACHNLLKLFRAGGLGLLDLKETVGAAPQLA
jgi:transposase